MNPRFSLYHMVISDTNSDQYKWVRQFISDFIGGENADAFLLSLADEHQNLSNLSVAVNNSLTISMSGGEYLDRVLAGYGITRPADLGLSDDAFRKIGIAINAQKQITDVIHTILEIFFGEESVRAYAQSTVAGPYAFEDGDELFVELENGTIYNIPFDLTNFTDPSQVSAQEASDVITRFFSSQSLNAYSKVYTDSSTQLQYVRIFGSAKGPYSLVQIQGGRVQSVMQFPDMRPTELAVNTTVWQVTRNVSSTIRFRWYSGPKPALESLFPNDIANIFGQPFVLAGIDGSFPITNVRAAGVSPEVDSGYFEVSIPELSGLNSIQVDTIPPPNSGGNIYSFLVNQGAYEDLTFFAPKKNVPYGQSRFALAFEAVSGTLQIYLPATTQVVERALTGGMHMHMKYTEQDLDGTFGSSLTNDTKNQIIIISDMAFKYPALGYDMDSTGGEVTINAPSPYTIPVNYCFREQGYTTVVCAQPHGLPDQSWSPNTNYSIGNIAYYQGATYQALQATGPLSMVEPPADNPVFWQFQEYSQNYSDYTITLDVDFVESDDPANPFLGSYIVDPAAGYALTSDMVTTREALRAGQRKSTLYCQGELPNAAGILLFGLNTDQQEGPVNYFGAQVAGAATAIPLTSASQVGTTITVVTTQTNGAIPGSTVVIAGTGTPIDGTYVVTNVISPTVYQCTAGSPGIYSSVGVGTSTTQVNGVTSTLLIDPSYSFKYDHAIATDVTVLSSQFAYVPAPDGSDYSPYITGSPDGRIYCQSLIDQIVACGINLNITVVYPGSTGVGNDTDGTLATSVPQNDIVWIYGGDT
jgi:hypothetical protein